MYLMSYIPKLTETSMSNIDFLTAHVINLLSNAKITFSQGGMPGGTVHLTDLQNQKVSGSQTDGFYILRSFDGFHKCITTTDVRSVQFMDIETVGDYKTKTKDQRPKMQDPHMFTTIGSNYS